MGRINWLAAPDLIQDKSDELEDWLRSLILERSYTVGGISYHFHSDDSIQTLNKEVLQHDYPTDIITFNYTKGKRLKVDIAIGSDTVVANAEERGLDPLEEYCRVLIHGLLHCMGWDDSTDSERLLMREEEEKCLLSRPK